MKLFEYPIRNRDPLTGRFVPIAVLTYYTRKGQHRRVLPLPEMDRLSRAFAARVVKGRIWDIRVHNAQGYDITLDFESFWV